VIEEDPMIVNQQPDRAQNAVKLSSAKKTYLTAASASQQQLEAAAAIWYSWPSEPSVENRDRRGPDLDRDVAGYDVPFAAAGHDVPFAL
jgi:hypothetical protein